jgi:hypothetical protein
LPFINLCRPTEQDSSVKADTPPNKGAKEDLIHRIIRAKLQQVKIAGDQNHKTPDIASKVILDFMTPQL